jgi:hypothetical protein
LQRVAPCLASQALASGIRVASWQC